MATVALDPNLLEPVLAPLARQACLIADSGRIDPHHVGHPVVVLEGVLLARRRRAMTSAIYDQGDSAWRVML